MITIIITIKTINSSTTENRWPHLLKLTYNYKLPIKHNYLLTLFPNYSKNLVPFPLCENQQYFFIPSKLYNHFNKLYFTQSVLQLCWKKERRKKLLLNFGLFFFFFEDDDNLEIYLMIIILSSLLLLMLLCCSSFFVFVEQSFLVELLWCFRTKNYIKIIIALVIHFFKL